MIRNNTKERNFCALCLVKYLAQVGADGTIVLGGRRKNLGDKLDLRTEPIGHVSSTSSRQKKTVVAEYNMKTATLIALMAVLACRFSFAETRAEQEVLQFERDACKAFLDADPVALKKVLTPDFTLTLSNGEVGPLGNEVDELRTGKVHYDVFENYDMKARIYGDNVAIVLGKTHVKGTSEGNPFDHVVQFTDTLIKRDGRWQLAAGHVSRIEK